MNFLFSPDRELFEKVVPIQNSSVRVTDILLHRHSHVRALHVHCVVIGREFCWASFPGEISSGCGWPPTTDALAQRSGEGTAQECQRSLVKPQCRFMAHCRSSGVLHSRSGHRRITDVPARMSVHRRIPDVAQRRSGPNVGSPSHSRRGAEAC